ncbi:hypothetical protein IQ268_08530 [Oculatella sp. LEGE 06141]|uniref:hypothetical protein n=1 Tax=Oculatella sp. LEGE 06141 TaxID=1828648 RepID=UPI00187FD3F2|nr:hypothetical protein [Oculatella sp. LEGE 06141]MBE9178603.1 hypothetical protein [Oculatella sp. LEGE 06141]
MILTPGDKALWFPEVKLSGSALRAAIARSQMTAESSKGANRPLELQGHVEVKQLHITAQSCYLSRIPIAELPEPKIEARCGGHKDGFGRLYPISAWQVVPVDGYDLDYGTGRLQLAGGLAIATEIRATYTAGFDFAEDTPQTRNIKAAVAAILVYQTLEA